MLFISSIFFLFAAFINNWKGGGGGEKVGEMKQL